MCLIISTIKIFDVYIIYIRYLDIIRFSFPEQNFVSLENNKVNVESRRKIGQLTFDTMYFVD